MAIGIYPLNKDPTVWLDGASPANTCIPPSFQGTSGQQCSVHITLDSPSRWWGGQLLLMNLVVPQLMSKQSAARGQLGETWYLVSKSIVKGIFLRLLKKDLSSAFNCRKVPCRQIFIRILVSLWNLTYLPGCVSLI